MCDRREANRELAAAGGERIFQAGAKANKETKGGVAHGTDVTVTTKD